MPTNEVSRPSTDLFSDEFIIDPNKNYLEEYVGEGKKYANAEELAKSRAHADAHIARIEDEQKRLREELATRLSYQDFLDQIKSMPLNSQQTPPADDQPGDKSVLKPEEIERLVDQRLQTAEANRTANQNINTVVTKLQEVYGPNYAQHLKRQAAELGMSEQEVNTLAGRNPKALLKLLDVGEQKHTNIFQAPPRTQSTTLPSTQKRGDSYYEKIRKEDPNLYWTPQVQNELFASLKELGAEEFYKH